MKKRMILSGAVLVLAVACLMIYQRNKGGVVEVKQEQVQTRTSVRPAGVARSEGEWRALVGGAVKEEFASLMGEILSISDRGLREAIVAALMERWVAEDTEGLVVYLDSLEVGLAKNSLAACYGALQQVLTSLDPELGASDTVLLVIERLISHLADTDPEAALVWAEKWLLEDALQNALVSVARGLATRDVQRALAVVEKISSPLRHMQALATVGMQWALYDREAAIAWGRKIPNPGERALAMNAILLVAARGDAPAAAKELADLARDITEEYKKRMAADLAANHLTELDMANDTKTYREMVRDGVISGPESPDAELLAEAGKVIATSLSANDPLSGVKWSEGLDGSFLKLTSLTGALQSWAATDPKAAVNYINSEHGGNPALLNAIYQGWAAKDPVAAANGVQLVSNANDREAVLNTVFSEWSSHGDVSEAVSYMNELPANVVSDSMKMSMVQAMAYQSPVDAWNLAASIQHPGTQARALKAALSSLVFQDLSKAVSVYDNTTMPAETRERLGDVLAAAGAR